MSEIAAAVRCVTQGCADTRKSNKPKSTTWKIKQSIEQEEWCILYPLSFHYVRVCILQFVLSSTPASFLLPPSYPLPPSLLLLSSSHILYPPPSSKINILQIERPPTERKEVPLPGRNYKCFTLSNILSSKECRYVQRGNTLGEEIREAEERAE